MINDDEQFDAMMEKALDRAHASEGIVYAILALAYAVKMIRSTLDGIIGVWEATERK